MKIRSRTSLRVTDLCERGSSLTTLGELCRLASVVVTSGGINREYYKQGTVITELVPVIEGGRLVGIPECS